MTVSTSILDYLGEGTHADRPAAPPIGAGGIAIYYETDTTSAFLWDTAGAAWVAVGGGGGGGAMVQIARQVLGSSAATITFSPIAGTYNHLLIKLTGMSDGGVIATPVTVQLNGDATANYDNVGQQISGSGGGALFGAATAGNTFIPVCAMTGASGPANVSSTMDIELNDYANTTFYKQVNARGAEEQGATNGDFFLQLASGWWHNTAAITSITLGLGSGNFVAGTRATLYGIT